VPKFPRLVERVPRLMLISDLLPNQSEVNLSAFLAVISVSSALAQNLPASTIEKFDGIVGMSIDGGNAGCVIC